MVRESISPLLSRVNRRRRWVRRGLFVVRSRVGYELLKHHG
jgi:hypothetical protein